MYYQSSKAPLRQPLESNQYASKAYQSELEQNGGVASMSRKGDCWDNAVAESFFSTLKQELIHRQSWATRAQAHKAIGEYIDGFYNVRRRHSYLGYLSPLEFELAAALGQGAA